MADLKSCPFCGGEAEQKRVERTILGTEYFSIICTTCHCQTAGNQDAEKSIEAWNTRKPMEAVVAELEKVSFERFGNDGMGGQKVISLDDATSIVRGKERKYCGNCKHQPEPLTTCEWLKSQTHIIKECPRWEGKE